MVNIRLLGHLHCDAKPALARLHWQLALPPPRAQPHERAIPQAGWSQSAQCRTPTPTSAALLAWPELSEEADWTKDSSGDSNVRLSRPMRTRTTRICRQGTIPLMGAHPGEPDVRVESRLAGSVHSMETCRDQNIVLFRALPAFCKRAMAFAWPVYVEAAGAARAQ